MNNEKGAKILGIDEDDSIINTLEKLRQYYFQGIAQWAERRLNDGVRQTFDAWELLL